MLDKDDLKQLIPYNISLPRHKRPIFTYTVIIKSVQYEFYEGAEFLTGSFKLITYGREPKLPIFGSQENSEENLLTYSLVEDLPANKAQAKKNVEKTY
ncbi:hypothetical protein F8M41_014084 [Gigaspora margarita]|uniref:Uncharacterized protein n=1 Tax=Gigaspora margarita TaxID=4874 RepID=A0A8H3WVU9_GIGMA|nr:hypothetical protein F8M41_014084 [Gigaspora margarita]